VPKSVLITGGARRIGAALLRGFADAGYRAALHYHRSHAEAKALAHETGATLHCFDLTQPGAPETLMAEVAAQHPDLSVLINNASTFRRISLMQMSEQSLQGDLAINLMAPLHMMRAFASQVAANPSAAIINMLDTAISQNQPHYFAYLLAKKALAEATKMAAIELAPAICVNGICPGYILPSEDGTAQDPQQQALKNPAQRLAEVSEVVDTALYLAKSRAHYGQWLRVDAGEHLL